MIWKAFLIGPKGFQDWLEMGVFLIFLDFKFFCRVLKGLRMQALTDKISIQVILKKTV